MAVPHCPGLETSAHPPHVRIRSRHVGDGEVHAAAAPRFLGSLTLLALVVVLARASHLQVFPTCPCGPPPIDRAPPRVTRWAGRWSRAARIPIRRSTRCRVVSRHPTGYLPTPARARASHLPPPARNRVIPRRGTQPHATHGVRSDGWNASEEPHAAMAQRAGRSPLPPFLSKKPLPNRVHTSRCPVTSDHRCFIYISPPFHTGLPVSPLPAHTAPIPFPLLDAHPHHHSTRRETESIRPTPPRLPQPSAARPLLALRCVCM